MTSIDHHSSTPPAYSETTELNSLDYYRDMMSFKNFSDMTKSEYFSEVPRSFGW